MPHYLLRSVLLCCSAGLVACGSDSTAPPPPQADTTLQPALVPGSAEHPDPVLVRVRELERTGAVRDVVVLESFPVQIRLRASAQTLAELQAMPRKGVVDPSVPPPGP